MISEIQGIGMAVGAQMSSDGDPVFGGPKETVKDDNRQPPTAIVFGAKISREEFHD
jgi:hypothetical protein